MNTEYVKKLFNLFYGSESAEGYGIHIAEANRYVKSIAKDENADDLRLCFLAAAIAVKEVRKTNGVVLHHEDPLLEFSIKLVDSYFDLCKDLIDVKRFTETQFPMSDDHIFFWVRSANTKINEHHEQITESLLLEMKNACIGKSVRFDIPGSDPVLNSGAKIVDSLIEHEPDCDVLNIKLRIPRVCITEEFYNEFRSRHQKPIAHITYYCPNQVCSICGRNFSDPKCNHDSYDRLIMLKDPCEIFEIILSYDD